MKLLADENVEEPIVAFLRAEGQDVLYVIESFRSTSDPDILAIASTEARVIVTSDLDFGELVFHRKLNSHGILLMRLKTSRLEEKLELFRRHWNAAASQIEGHFVVMTRNRIRVRPLS